jgi:hypothetical protein
MLACYRHAGLCLLIGVGLCLIQMWWPLSYRVSFLPGRGSWIAGKASSPCGRMDWWLLSAPLERCAQKVMPVTYELRLSSKTSLPRRMPLAPCPNSSLASIRRWRNIRSSVANRRQTRRCKRRYWRRIMRTTCIPPMGGTCRQN